MEEEKISILEQNQSSDSKSVAPDGGFDMNAALLLSAKQTEAKVAAQIKKQKLIAAIVALEGAIALIAGILVLALSDIIAVGIALLLVGAFIVTSVLVMNARTIKKLKLMLDRAKGIEKQIAEGKFETGKANGENENKKA